MRSEDFEQAYDEHAQGLYAFLVYRTGDPTLAEDLVADTFERVLRARRSFDKRKSGEKSWLYAIALNRLRDVTRRQGVESRALQLASENGASANGHSERLETRQVVMTALQALPDEEREVVALRYGADLRLAEIAAVIGKPRSTVEGRLYRGLRRLRSELERESRTLTDVGSMP
jgi:RNA polymerase sigma factor (sigma-70 family)